MGRRAEVAALRRLVENHPAVTVVGTGGIGKTRLALHTAAAMSRAFDDGVWLVELDPVADPELLASTVLLGLGQRDDGGASAEEQLVERLRPLKLLLVLDGCDRLAEACAFLAGRLLREAPGLRLITTSRRRLRMPGEALLPLSPMPVPKSSTEPADPGPLLQFEAVSLFVDRCRAIRPDFALTAENASLVTHICQQLGGLPMAIELAAERLDVLSLDQLAERLDDSYRLLVTGRRGAPARQQTLRALVDSSFELCSAAERLLWARLSVFTGRFDLAAAERVGAGDDLAVDEVFDVLAGLADKSVLVRDDSAYGSWYRMHPLLREYGWARLGEAQEHAAAREGHAQWCLEMAEQAARGWFDVRQDRRFNQLRGHHADVRAALEFCFEEPDDDATGLRIASSLWFYWMMAGRIGEGRGWLDRGLRRDGPGGLVRVRALGVNAYLAAFERDVGAACTLLELGREENATVGDPVADGYFDFVEGLVGIARGEVSIARTHLDDALVTLRDSPDVTGVSETLFLAALASTLDGDIVRCRALCEEFLELADARGEEWGRGYIQWVAALNEWQDGRFDEAERAERMSVERMVRFDDQLGLRWCVQTAPLMLAAREHHEDAARLMGTADAHRVPIFAVLDPFRSRAAGELLAALGDRRYAELVAEGGRLPLAQALDVFPFQGARAVSATEGGGAVESGPALTQREQEVVDLVAQGLTNKEIAGMLVISLRTAEGHVQRLLNKLGFTSRAQIAAWAAGRQVTTSGTSGEPRR